MRFSHLSGVLSRFRRSAPSEDRQGTIEDLRAQAEMLQRRAEPGSVTWMIYQGLHDGLDRPTALPRLILDRSDDQHPDDVARRTGLLTGSLIAFLMADSKFRIASDFEPLVAYCTMVAGDWAGNALAQPSERDLLKVHAAGCVRAEIDGRRLPEEAELRLFDWFVGTGTPESLVTSDLTPRVLEWRARRIERMTNAPPG
jgi:hypothetical protein